MRRRSFQLAVGTAVLAAIALAGLGVGTAGAVDATAADDGSDNITVTPEGPVAFGNVSVGETERRNVTVENTGQAEVNLTGASLPDQEAYEVITALADVALQPEENVTVEVQFEPETAGNAASTLLIYSRDVETQLINLTGTGIAPDVGVTTGEPVDFGEVNVGNRSQARTVTIENDGTAPLNLSSASIRGPNGSQFAFGSESGDPTPHVVQPEASASFEVEYQPNSLGTDTAFLNVSHNVSYRSDVNVTLTGTGVDTEPPALDDSSTGALDANRSELERGESLTLAVNVTDNVAVENVTVNATPLGADTVELTDETGNDEYVGTVALDAVNATPGPTTLTAQASDSSGNSNASLDTADVTVAISAVTVSDDSLAFGTEPVNETTTENVTIANDGVRPLDVSSIAITGTNASTFELTRNPAGTVLQPGENVTASVTLNRTMVGTPNATLDVETNASDSTVVLSGASTRVLSGTVTGYAGVLGGATVTVEETNVTNVTRGDGRYSLTVADPSPNLTITHTFPDGETFEQTYAASIENDATRNVTHVPSLADVPRSDGTYRISTVRELQAMAEDRDADYALVSDVDASATADWNGGAGFASIGTVSTPFTGTLDGRRHLVSNLTIDRPNESHVGLVAVSGGTIRNIGLANASVVGNASVGTIAGRSNGTVASSFATGSLQTLGTQVPASGGGLVGYDGGMVTSSYANVTVDATGSGVGGLVGTANDSTIRSSFASGNVGNQSDAVGGLVGRANETSVRSSYATGRVDAGGDGGGLVGVVGPGPTNLTDSYWNEATTNRSDAIGGGVDEANRSDVEGLGTENMTGGDAVRAMDGLAYYDDWAVVENDYPRPLWDANVQAGSEADPFEVSTAAELQAMRGNLSAYYELVSNVNASTTTGWNGGTGFDPIGGDADEFVGTFDGNGHAIAGLTIDRSDEDQIGFFGAVGVDGTVTNVSLENASVLGDWGVGTIAGSNLGTISSATVSGNVSGERNVGGLVGNNFDTIDHSSVTADVSGTSDNVGGLVGNHYDTVTRSYAIGNVSGENNVGGLVGKFYRGRVEAAYATGNVSGSAHLGGLVGNTTSSGVRAGYYDVNATNQSGVAGTPLTTAEMTGASAVANMSGFDYGTNWTATSGYPALSDDSAAPFALAVEDANAPVEAGEMLTVDVRVENLGGFTDTGAIELRAVDGSVVDARAVTLEGDAATTETLTWATTDATDGNVTVVGPVSNRTVAVTVQAPPGAGDGNGAGSGVPNTGSPSDPDPVPATFAVSNVSIDDPVVEPGQQVTLGATVRNVGDEIGERTFALTVDGERTETRTVTLAGGESAGVEFSWVPETAGEYEVGVDGAIEPLPVVVESNESGGTDPDPPDEGDGGSDDGGDGGSDDDGSPGFGAIAAVLGVVGALAIARLRR